MNQHAPAAPLTRWRGEEIGEGEWDTRIGDCMRDGEGGGGDGGVEARGMTEKSMRECETARG